MTNIMPNCYLISGEITHAPTCLPTKQKKHLYNICTMLEQRRRRLADVVQMLYNLYVFTGLDPHWMPPYISLQEA